MIITHLIQQIHDLCVHLYNEGLDKDEWEHYEDLSIEELQDMIHRLKLQMI